MPLLMCPNDNSPMQEINRNGVMIDSCPQCRGVWMDRGELEKLLELARPVDSASDRGGERGSRHPDRRPDQYRANDGSSGQRPPDEDRGHTDDSRRYDDRHKRRRKFDLFDFFD